MERNTSYSSLDSQLAIEQAKQKGFEVIKSNPYLILLDLDSEKDLNYYHDNLTSVSQNVLKTFGITLTEVAHWQSKSGQGWHVVIETNDYVDLATRLMIQVALGSDRKKEFLSFIRSCEGMTDPCVLFKPKAVTNASRT